MAGYVNNVNFSSPGFDYAAQLADIQRRQQMADALQQQSMQAPEAQVIGGMGGRVSPFQVLGKWAQGLASGYQAQQAQQRQAALSQQYQTDYSTKAQQWADLLQGKPATAEIPMPSDDLGGGPGRDAQPAVAPDPAKAMSIAASLPGGEGMQTMAANVLQQQIQAKQVQDLIGGGGQAPSAPAQPGAPDASGAPFPTQDAASAAGSLGAPTAPAAPAGPAAATPPPGAIPTGSNAALIQKLMLSGNPLAQNYAKVLIEQSKPSGGVQYDQKGNAYVLDSLGNPKMLAGISRQAEGITQNTGDKTGLVDKFTGTPMGQAVPMQVSPGERLTASTAIRGQNMTDSRDRAIAAQTNARDYAIAGLGTNGAPNPNTQSMVDLIGQYKAPPLSGFALARPAGQQIMAGVAQKYPDYNAQDYAASQAGVKAFATGKQGDATRFLNVGTQHVVLFDQAMQAQANGNIPLFNKIANVIGTQTGKPAPTTVQALADLVGGEVSKAVIGGPGGEGDRDKARALFSGISSPAQWAGKRDAIAGLMSGQLNGLALQYKNATKRNDFNQFLAPETQQFLGMTQPSAAGAPSTDGWTVKRIP